MNARMETIKRLAESDPYWRGYLDGMTAAHHDNSAAHEYARLSQARLDRNADTTDYDSEWSRNEVAVSPHSEETRRARDMSEAMLGRMDFALDAYRSRTASPGVFAWSADASPIEEVRERLRARRLGLPYPARLDVDPR